MSGPVRVPKTTCFNCGHTLDAVDGPDMGEPPRPGDVTVCLTCAHVMKFGADLKLEGFTEEEARALAADPRLCRDLARIVKDVRFVITKMAERN
jgi:hypothetical protein